MTDSTDEGMRSVVAKGDARIARRLLFWQLALFFCWAPFLVLVILQWMLGQVDEQTWKMLTVLGTGLGFWLFVMVIGVLTRKWEIYRQLPKCVALVGDEFHVTMPAAEFVIDPTTCIWWHGEMAHDSLGLILPWRYSLVIDGSEQRCCIVATSESGYSRWLSEFERLGMVESRLRPWRRKSLCILIGVSPIAAVALAVFAHGIGAWIAAASAMDGWDELVSVVTLHTAFIVGVTHVGALWRRPLTRLAAPELPVYGISSICGVFAATAAQELLGDWRVTAVFALVWLVVGLFIAWSFIRMAWPAEGAA